jgi:hypothetical protein
MKFILLALLLAGCSSGVLVNQDTCKYTGLVKDGHPIDRCQKADM